MVNSENANKVRNSLFVLTLEYAMADTMLRNDARPMPVR